MALNLAGTIGELILDQRRLNFPACADTIVIPIFGMMVFTIIATPLAACVGYFIARFFRPLPIPLGIWDADRRLRSWAITVPAALLCVIMAAQILICLTTAGALTVPAMVGAIYLIESTRSALIASVRES